MHPNTYAAHPVACAAALANLQLVEEGNLVAAWLRPFRSGWPNYNLIIGNAAIDPVSGSVPHRAYLCEIRRAE